MTALDPDLDLGIDDYARADLSGFMPDARSVIKLERYLNHQAFHLWSGELDNELIIYSKPSSIEAFASLAAKTLIDDKNEIKFRLVRLYYDFSFGLRHKVENFIFDYKYSHKCSHGIDSVKGRILIDSGPLFSAIYYLNSIKHMLRAKISLSPIFIGQNKDLNRQLRFISQAAFRWFPLLISGERLFFEGALSFAIIDYSASSENYYIFNEIGDLSLEKSFLSKIGFFLRKEKGLKSSLEISFSRSLDSGFGEASESLDLLALHLNFFY